jgi:hypothetical protein
MHKFRVTVQHALAYLVAAGAAAFICGQHHMEIVKMTNAQTEVAQAPEGFGEILSPMDHPRLVLTPGQSVVGKVVDKVTEVFEKKGGDDEVTFLIVETLDGKRRVSESASLMSFVREAQVGDEVWIHFVGEEKSNHASPLKRYRTAIKGRGK